MLSVPKRPSFTPQTCLFHGRRPFRSFSAPSGQVPGAAQPSTRFSMSHIRSKAMPHGIPGEGLIAFFPAGETMMGTDPASIFPGETRKSSRKPCRCWATVNARNLPVQAALNPLPAVPPPCTQNTLRRPLTNSPVIPKAFRLR